MTNAVASWDFRMNAEGLHEDVVIASLKRIAKHYVFQEERGEGTGYVHYQGRFSLIKKRRKSELLKDWAELELEMPVPNYLQPTTTGEHKTTSFSYMMKEVTRTRGPWSDKKEQEYVPIHLRGMSEKMYPWQRHIYESGSVPDWRAVDLLYDPLGARGKSTVSLLTMVEGKGIVIPPVNDAKELMQSVCDMCMSTGERSPGPFFLDMPRAMGKDKLFGIYSAIEQIKNGYLYDFRYSFKKWMIDSPRIWVFTNTLPDLSLLSADRWRIWVIDDRTGALKRYGETQKWSKADDLLHSKKEVNYGVPQASCSQEANSSSENDYRVDSPPLAVSDSPSGSGVSGELCSHQCSVSVGGDPGPSKANRERGRLPSVVKEAVDNGSAHHPRSNGPKARESKSGIPGAWMAQFEEFLRQRGYSDL